MAQMGNGNRINHHLRSIAGNVTSPKGIVIQLLSCQLALPAIANDAASPEIPSILPETETNHEYSGPFTADWDSLTVGQDSIDEAQPESAQVIYEHPIYTEVYEQPNIYAPIVYEQPADKQASYETTIHGAVVYVPEQVAGQAIDAQPHETIENGLLNIDEATALTPAKLEPVEGHSVAAHSTELYIESHSIDSSPVDNSELLPVSQIVSTADSFAQPPAEVPLSLIQQIETNELTAEELTDTEPESWLADTIHQTESANTEFLKEATIPTLIPQTTISTSRFTTQNTETSLESIALQSIQAAHTQSGSIKLDSTQTTEFDPLVAAPETLETAAERAIERHIEYTDYLINHLAALTYEQYPIEAFIPTLTPQVVSEANETRFKQEPVEIPLALVQQIADENIITRKTTKTEPESWLNETIHRIEADTIYQYEPYQSEPYQSEPYQSEPAAELVSVQADHQTDYLINHLTELTYAQAPIEEFIPALIPQLASDSERAAAQSSKQDPLVVPLALVQQISSDKLTAAELTESELTETEPESWLDKTTHRIALTAGTENVPNVSLSPTQPILLAGPESLNPGLRAPSDAPSPTIPSVVPSVSGPQPVESPNSGTTTDTRDRPSESDSQPETSSNRFITWENLSVGFGSNFDSFDQGSWRLLPTLEGVLSNGDRLAFTTGLSRFSQADIESVTHTPFTVRWKGQRGPAELEIGAGLDIFNRLPFDTHFDATVSVPISSTATVSVAVEQGPYIFNAQTLENQISNWRYGPNFAWQITPNTNFFSALRFGNYSDGNQEVQSFSRLERSIGDTATAALTLTTDSFDQDVIDTSGYFSPPDFLIATAELSWQEPISENLTCGLSGSLGQQRLEGQWAVAYNNNVTCSIAFSPKAQVDLGYQISNTSNGQSLFSDNAYTNQSIFGGIRIQF
ncbi:MAG: hypothetical protein AAF703_14925 [Cyanobacteria bacterium P01_D01_bin.105]